MIKKSSGIEQHAIMHSKGKRFQGFSTLKHVHQIKKLIDDTNSRVLLDYGCGKGMQYLHHRVHDIWGVPLPYCYDPGLEVLSKLPDTQLCVDGVICVDVMEHVEERFIDIVLETVYSYAGKFVYFNISTKESRKTLKDGRNAHLTIKSENWWMNKINAIKNNSIVTEVSFT